MSKSKPRDQRGRLDGSPFSYRAAKDGKVFISWQGRQVMILKDAKAKAFLSRLEGLDEARRQMAMARITGNFKRGGGR